MCFFWQHKWKIIKTGKMYYYYNNKKYRTQYHDLQCTLCGDVKYRKDLP